MKLIPATIVVESSHWGRIRALANSEGLNASSKLRQLVAVKLRAAAKDGRMPSEDPTPAPGQKKARK